MREDGTRAARQDGGHVEPLALEELLGDEGIDAAVNTVEATGADSPTDRRGTETERDQLVEAEDPVLLTRELGQRRVKEGLAEKRDVEWRFSARLGHNPDVLRENVTCVTRCVAIRPRALALKT